MQLDRLTLSINNLLEFWKKQDIDSPSSLLKEDNVDRDYRFLHLPDDFIQLYSRTNGMAELYPNEMDDEGFLFYPVEAIVSADVEFENCNLNNKNDILIFAEYMHKSWWYGVKVNSSEDYTIGILPHENFFKPITNSLSEFIEMYLEDSFELYDYS